MSDEFVTSGQDLDNDEELSNLPGYDDVKDTIDNFKEKESGDDKKSPDSSDEEKPSQNGDKTEGANSGEGNKPEGSQNPQGNNTPQQGGSQGGSNVTSGPMGDKAQKEAAEKLAKQQVGNAGLESSGAGSGLGGAGVTQGAAQGASQGAGAATGAVGEQAAQKAGEEVAKKAGEQVAKETGKAAAKTTAKTAAKSNPYSGIAVAALEVLKKTWDAVKSNDSNAWFFVLAIAAILMIICVVILNAPSLIYNVAVKETKYVIGNTYKTAQAKYSAKGKFFSDLFSDKYPGITYAEIYDSYHTDAQGAVDANDAMIYKAIADYAIEQAFTTNIPAILMAPAQVVKSIGGDWVDNPSWEGFAALESELAGCLMFYDVNAQLEAYKKLDYPYSSIKSSGQFYTIGECIDKTIPEDKLNDQVDYSEIFAVLSQNEDYQFENITYEEFYDLMLDPDTQLLLMEMYFGKEHIWYYNDGSSMQEFPAEDYGGNVGACKAAVVACVKDWFATLDAHPKETVLKVFDSLTGAFIGLLQDVAEEVLGKGKTYIDESPDEDDSTWKQRIFNTFFGGHTIGYYYKIEIAPYGLSELYYIFDVQPLDDYIGSTVEFHDKMTNLDMLDWQELLEYQYLGRDHCDLGYIYKDTRKSDSPAYKYYIEQGTKPTYRSLAFYLPERLGKGLTWDSWGEMIGGLYSTDVIYWDANGDFIPVGKSVQLNLIQYVFSQGLFGNVTRGHQRSSQTGKIYSVQQAGCIDSCFAMAMLYFSNNSSAIPDYELSEDWMQRTVCKDDNYSGQGFLADKFCAENGLGYRNAIGDNANIIETITNSIDEGNPLIFSLGSQWTGADTGTTYYGGKEHWMMIYGYDDAGIYVADPNGGRIMSVPFNDWDSCPMGVLDVVSPTDSDSYEADKVITVDEGDNGEEFN